MIEELRQFIRHPSNIPLSFCVRGRHQALAMKDVGHGGLCFSAPVAIAEGECIQIQIPFTKPAFSAEGLVRWCRPEGQQFLIGVAFTDKSVRFAMRMVEQLCYIENYRKQLAEETGVDPGSEKAAIEWIEKFAAQFPELAD